jgi:hypothetical protein
MYALVVVISVTEYGHFELQSFGAVFALIYISFDVDYRQFCECWDLGACKSKNSKLLMPERSLHHN